MDTGPDAKKSGHKTPSRVTRRGFLALAGLAAVTGGAGAAQWFNVFAENGEAALTPVEAHEAAAAGTILLVDVRRPDEWAKTGIGDGAVPIDMRRPDFEATLLQAVSGDKATPIAVICARGVRSRRMTDRLTAAGFSRIIDVPEGMLGSGAGPGWLKRGLPVVFP